MFTDLYLRSTNPDATLADLFKTSSDLVFISVVFHTIVYLGAANLASFLFLGKKLPYETNTRLALALALIMFFGYIARHYHVKDIYSAYQHDRQLTRAHMDKLYISWVFIG